MTYIHSRRNTMKRERGVACDLPTSESPRPQKSNKIKKVSHHILLLLSSIIVRVYPL